jgi:Icc-related predicted phosphoesterase
MKLLLTADFHFRVAWFRWLIEQASHYDLICVAGDLLDMFKSKTRLEQSLEVKKLISELADKVTVALCSGNHDNAGRQVSPDRAPVYKWLVDLAAHRNIVTDGTTKKLEDLIVTTVPYHCSKEQKSVGSRKLKTARSSLLAKSCVRLTQIILFSILNPERVPGTPPARPGYRKTAFLTTWS